MTICTPPGGGAPKFYSGPCPAGWAAAGGTPSGGSSTAPAAGTGTTKRPTRWVPDEGTAWVPRLPNDPGRFVDTSSLTGIGRTMNPDSGINATYSTQTGADAAWYNLSPNEQALFTFIAKQEGGRSGKVQYENFVDQSAAQLANGTGLTPMTLAYQYAVGIGWIKDGSAVGGSGPGGGSGGGGGGGGGAAPVAAGPDAVKRVMDSLANDLLGRTLSDKEFRRYYGSYRSAFAGNPGMDMQQHGTEALQGNDDYQEFQVASKFATAMDSVLRGAS